MKKRSGDDCRDFAKDHHRLGEDDANFVRLGEAGDFADRTRFHNRELVGRSNRRREEKKEDGKCHVALHVVTAPSSTSARNLDWTRRRNGKLGT